VEEGERAAPTPETAQDAHIDTPAGAAGGGPDGAAGGGAGADVTGPAAPSPDIWASTAPWAMQLAVLDRRPDRPTHLAVCEAAASAVVTLLADPRAQTGEWAPQVRRWASGPIRKVVRRGRGVKWAATDDLVARAGVEVARRGATVRAFVPVPIDTLGRELSTLQVGGTQMPEVGEPAEHVPGGLTIALTPDADLSTGKAAAQSGHAAHVAWQSMPAGARDRWAATGWAVSVVLPGAADWRRLTATWPVSIRDGGFTEVRPGTMTAVAGW
jgi:peptidyl-tRNA hydrolase